jgi:hypothetical protein
MKRMHDIGALRAGAGILVIGLALAASGCGAEGDDPAGSSVRDQQIEPGGAAAPTDAPYVVASLAWPVPGDWTYVEPDTDFRAGEFRVETEAGPCEVVFFHFGRGQGGDAEANLMRWARVMLDEAGEPVEPEIEVFDVSGVRTVAAEYAGTYMAGPPMGEKEEMENYKLLGAVIEGGPEGNVFIRLTGPAEAVDAVRDDWMAMLRGVRSAGA